MASTEVTQIILVTASIIASVVLAISCLFTKRFRKKERNESSQVSNKSKSGEDKSKGNGTVKGITNTGFTERDSEIYENGTDQYDYAKNDGRFVSRDGKTKDELVDNVSPLYAEARDGTSQFYYTLERPIDETTIDVDDGKYVVVIPENVYDTPENENEVVSKNENEGQVYHTLEECSEENEAAIGNENFTPVTHNIKDRDEKDRVQNIVSTGTDYTSDEDTYVINIPSDGISETDIYSNGCSKITTESEVGVEKITIDIRNDSTNTDGYLGQAVTHKDIEENSGKSVKDEDTVDTNEDIYQNVNECLNPKNNEGRISQKPLTKDYAVQVEKRQITTIHNTKTEDVPNEQDYSHENTGYIDDEILPHNGREESSVDDDSPYVIQVEALNESNGSRDSPRYFDDDIYEDWEDNIIGRTKSLRDESRDELDAECEDDIYQNAIILVS